MQPSPDAVEEFKVVTNNYSAEYGRSGGATINVAYASGTNQFRGSAWEFARRTALNATGFFRPASGVKPPFERDQFGGVLGGPIVRNRAFFFADYEGFDQTRGTTAFSTIPNLAQRQGILAVDVRNPFTGVLYPAGTPIPMTAFARKVLTELPAPTSAAASNNYQVLQNFANTTHKAGGKVNVQINPALSVVRPLRLARRRHLRRSEHPAAVRRRRQRVHLRPQQAAGARHDVYADFLVAARGALRVVAHRGRQGSGGARHDQRAGRVRHQRPAERSARGGRLADADHHRLLGSGPSGDEPAVAVSDGLQPEGQLHVAGGPPLAQDRLRAAAHPDRGAGRQSAVRPRRILRRRSAVRPA